jgi:uncharacterized protein
MSVGERMADLSNSFFLRIRHREAFRAAGEPGTEQGFEALRGHKYALLTTFRRSGDPVPTPVWFGVDRDGRAYFHSEARLGKVKRIRNDPHVRLAPCNLRGRPVGPAAEGRARVLGPEDDDRAEAAIEANYGLGRKFFQSTEGSLDMVYVEVSPV